MSKKNKKEGVNSLLVILVLAMLVISFFIGTLVGFRTGVQAGVEVISKCVLVDCETLGLEAEKCEVCIDRTEEQLRKLAG
jgi:hypothetical protein